MNDILLKIIQLRAEGRHEEAAELEMQVSAAGAEIPACPLCNTPVENQPGQMYVLGAWVPCTICGDDINAKTGWDLK